MVSCHSGVLILDGVDVTGYPIFDDSKVFEFLVEFELPYDFELLILRSGSY